MTPTRRYKIKNNKIKKTKNKNKRNKNKNKGQKVNRIDEVVEAEPIYEAAVLDALKIEDIADALKIEDMTEEEEA